MTAPAGVAPSALLQRWHRLQLQVRCALDPARPALVAQYLVCGTRLTRRAMLPALPTQQQMLNTLLQTASDAALPWSWRSVCLEHAVQPLARLSALLRLHDGQAYCACEAAVRDAWAALPATPPRPAG